MSEDPKNKNQKPDFFDTQDDPLLEDLSSALMSEKPEEHLNFKLISKGLGLHDLKKSTPILSPILSKDKGFPVTFTISDSESQEDGVKKVLQLKKKLSLFLLRSGSILIDGTIIFTISLMFYNISLFILLGNFSKKTFNLIASVFPIFFNNQSIIYFFAVFLLVWIAYFLAFQSITGSTIGKILFSLKLMRKDGSKPNINHILTFRTQVVSET